MQRRLRRMLEDRERFDDTAHAQLLTLAEAAQERSLQKVKALAALKLLSEAFPELGMEPWHE
ncbi:MAG: hypothetical protein HY721_19465 [Planctomycetes bacterium]|nr:hypothetical protein [Planctomycetota bacterium]